MSQRYRSVSLLLILVLVLSWFNFGAPVTVKAADTASGTVVASGFASPRYAVVGDDGSVYVSEAGGGGSEAIAPVPGAPPQAPIGQPSVRGYVGKVTKVAPNGTKTVVADKLASFGAPDDAVGPSGLVLAGGYLWLSVGGGSIERGIAPLDNEGAILRINPSTGEIKKIADLGAYERDNNPDKQDVNSNLYGLAYGSNGKLYATDAGGNDLFSVDPTTGSFSLVTVFPNLPSSGPRPLQPVPTGVAVAGDGSVYVGHLSGSPFPAGAAKVVKVSASGAVSDYATGFTMVTGVAIGPDKNVYVTEITGGFSDSGNEPPKPGKVTRVLADGTKQVVADGLLLPNSVTFDKAGNMYVLTGTATPAGQLVRYNNIAPAPGGSLPNTGAPADGARNFPQTGYSIGGLFLSYWDDNGGLDVFGYPIDSERLSNGQVLQWLERTRFEAHPENSAPYNVLLGRVGLEALVQQGTDWTTLPKVTTAAAGCRYYAQTGHSLCSDFLRYWDTHGLEFDGKSGKTYAESLALFGLPLSEPTMQLNSSGEMVLTQWFERARFEFHPNNPDKYKVQLGLLGAEVNNRNGR